MDLIRVLEILILILCLELVFNSQLPLSQRTVGQLCALPLWYDGGMIVFGILLVAMMLSAPLWWFWLIISGK